MGKCLASFSVIPLGDTAIPGYLLLHVGHCPAVDAIQTHYSDTPGFQ